MFHSETIYDLIPEEKVPRIKHPRYKSQYREIVKNETQENRYSHRTMGLQKEPPPDAKNFVKKHTRDFIPTENKDFKYPDEDRRKPPIPSIKDKPHFGMKTTKNFINTNAVETITSVPKKPVRIYVDKNDGNKILLEPSGLEPKFIHKKDYGEVPEYIHQIRADKEKAQQEYDNYVTEYFKRGSMKLLTEDERQQIIDGLKANWQEMYHNYLGLSVVIDTVPKQYSKQRMENEMKQLEHDISLMEKHSRIYVAN